MKSIPTTVFPLAIDSDYTLFKTYNSTQSILSSDLGEKDVVINILPQSANAAEIWADNGFVTIQDELVYYDSVVKDDNNKVKQLKECIRAVEGIAQSYNKGTPISANVVAQLHNQLVNAIVAIEDSIGNINDLLKVGTELKSQQRFRKNLIPNASKTNLVADVDFAFANSLNHSLTTMLGCAPVGDDACPDVEFEFNFMEIDTGLIGEYCIRIFGNYTSFEVDFGDGITESNQLSGVHQYAIPGPYNPTVTVTAPNCSLVQMPTTPNEFAEGPELPNPSVPFVVHIPDIPAFPVFTPQRTTCPGPLFNLPPILMPDINLCPSTVPSACPAPSVIISVIEACKTPQIIRIVSPCRLSNISLVGCCIPSQISIVGCCLPSIIDVNIPSIPCISFCEPPSFQKVSFDVVPSFSCIGFCPPPSFSPISFAPFPSIGSVSFDILVDLSVAPLCFCPPPSFDCISFCTPPSFDCISFCTPPSFQRVSFDVDLHLSPLSFSNVPSFACISFCEPPGISVIWGVPPTVSCVVTIQCPSTTSSELSDAPTDGGGQFAAGNFGGFQEPSDGIPVTINDLGIPEEIRLIVPRIPDINIFHEIPEEIYLRGPNEIKLVGPTEILLKSNLPSSIQVTHNLPNVFTLDASDLPRTILVEPALNFPTTLKMEITGMPQSLQVTGIPQAIEIIENIPRTIQLLMPENPVVEMKWNGVPVELKPSADLEKLFANLIVPPR